MATSTGFFVDLKHVACLKCTHACFLLHGGAIARPRITPSFIKVMNRQSNQYLMIPRHFTDLHLSKCVGEATLEGPSGEIWHAEFEISQKLMLLASPGWAHFVHDHDLQLGDMLIFSYLGRNFFKVRIFDAKDSKEKGMHCFPSNSQPAAQIPADTCIELQNSNNLWKDTQPDIGLQAQGSVHASQGTEKQLLLLPVPAPMSCNDYTEHKQQLIQKELNSSALISLSRGTQQHAAPVSGEKHNIVQMANAFKSQYPVVRKRMTPGLLQKMRFPKEFLDKLPSRDVAATLKDPHGKEWHCRWLGEPRGSHSPFLSAGWPGFAHAHSLVADDIVVFELITAIPLRLNVHIFKAN